MLIVLEHLDNPEREDLSVFLIRHPRFIGPTPLIPCGETRRALTALPLEKTLVAFVTDPVDSLEPMLGSVVRGEVEAAAAGTPVSEAVKAVRDDRIVDSVDRAGLAVVTGPEVARRSALSAALQATRSEDWVSVTALMAGSAPVSVTPVTA